MSLRDPLHLHHDVPVRDPFASGGIDNESPDSLEELYYRLEGKRLRLLYLEHSGAPRVVLEGARGGLRELEQRIQLRVRSILVRRNLDERLLLEELTPAGERTPAGELAAAAAVGSDEGDLWCDQPEGLDPMELEECRPDRPRAARGAVIERVVAHRIQQIALSGVGASFATSA